MCFTKAYARYIEGTGSVLTSLPNDELQAILKQIDEAKDESLDLKKSLKLRFFTPSEILKLMAFPEDFQFPQKINVKQQYKLLGNSINVAVVSELIKLLIS